MPTAARGRLSKWRGLSFESLELRTVLSAAATVDLSELLATPSIESLAAVTNTTPRGYTPSQIASAYGFNQIRFNGGTIVGNGAGQTITIVDAYDDPYIANDLAVFNQTFGLTTPFTFTKINQNGGSTMPRADAGWSEEIALDVEWAHAMAPGGEHRAGRSQFQLDLRFAGGRGYGPQLPRAFRGVDELGKRASSLARRNTIRTSPRPPGHTGVTFVASAGDSGAAAEWPAASPNVVSVGGTSLSISRLASTRAKRPGAAVAAAYSRVESRAQLSARACNRAAYAPFPTWPTTPTPTPASRCTTP